MLNFRGLVGFSRLDLFALSLDDLLGCPWHLSDEIPLTKDLEVENLGSNEHHDQSLKIVCLPRLRLFPHGVWRANL